jgi:hypothetical protein
MKFLISVMTLLLTFAAHAEIKVGNWAKFQTTTTHENGAVDLYKYKSTVVKISSGKVLVRDDELDKNDNVVSSTDNWQKLEEVIDKETGSQIITDCETPDIGGKLESITVPAGKFSTCKVVNDDSGNGTIWFAPVTFGLAKMQFNGQLDDHGQVDKFISTVELLAYGE